MIKAVYFDYGGVLTPGGLMTASKEVPAAYFGLDPEDIQNEDLDEQLRRGKLNVDGYFEELSLRYGPGMPLLTEDQYVEQTKNDIFTRQEKVYELAAKLRDSGIITGILSNISTINSRLLATHGYYDGFTPIVLSCNVGARKPDPVIYNIALTQIGTAAEKVVCIDDKRVNLEPAETFGMQTLLADPRDPDALVEEVGSMVLEQNGVKL